MEENKNVSGDFHPFQKKTSASSSTDTDGGGGGGSKGDDKRQTNKKERRWWSSDLHRLFLHVLQQLGGAHGVFFKFIINGLNYIIIFTKLIKVTIVYCFSGFFHNYNL